LEFYSNSILHLLCQIGLRRISEAMAADRMEKEDGGQDASRIGAAVWLLPAQH
jgi:hypothetical protein